MLKNRVILSLIIFSFGQQVIAENFLAPDLHTDPFVNPLTQQSTEPASMNVGEQREEAPTSKGTPRESFLWQPELRGIILSDDISIVNIGGDMIEVGMEYEGFRLIKVKGQSVVFEKNGKNFSISMEETK